MTLTEWVKNMRAGLDGIESQASADMLVSRNLVGNIKIDKDESYVGYFDVLHGDWWLGSGTVNRAEGKEPAA